MRKALAILATVATVGATAVSAPAQARGWGWGPGIGFGLAAGALAAGAYGAYGPYGYYGPGYGYYGYGPRYYGPAITATTDGRITDPDMGPMPIMAWRALLSAPLLAVLVIEMPGASLRAFYSLRFIAWDC